MGYNTNFSLKCSKEGLLEKIFDNAEDDYDSPFAYAFEKNGETADAIKWYEHEEDLLKLSKKHPGVIFTLSGEGEDSGDLWRKYFLNGKMQRAPAIITYDPFDSKKLT